MGAEVRQSKGIRNLARVFLALGSVTIVVGAVIGMSTAANAANVSHINPFAINGGFTVLAEGDITFAAGQGETEGSVATFGSLGVAGGGGRYIVKPFYDDPGRDSVSIDGKQTRVLAESFVNQGILDVQQATAKFSDTSSLTPSSHGFLTLTNAAGGKTEIKNLPSEQATEDDYTAASTVRSYFPNFGEQRDKVTECLVGYTQENTDIAYLSRPGDPFRDASMSKPNVIDYDLLRASTTANTYGYKPSAAAPLIVQVAAGTTQISGFANNSWGDRLALAPYVLFDLSAVTGTVKVVEIEAGSIWAPHASIFFETGVSTNGHWLVSGTVTASGGGEIHHVPFQGTIPCREGSTSPEPSPETTEPTQPTQTTESTETTETTESTETTEPSETTETTEQTTNIPETTHPTTDLPGTTTPSETTDPTNSTEPTESTTTSVEVEGESSTAESPEATGTKTTIPTTPTKDTITVLPTSDESLPHTGTRSLPLLGIGAAALVVGFGLLALDRRRQH